jgi:hypothetical protein
MAVIFESSEDHLNELGLSWSNWETVVQSGIQGYTDQTDLELHLYASMGSSPQFASGCYV